MLVNWFEALLGAIVGAAIVGDPDVGGAVVGDPDVGVGVAQLEDGRVGQQPLGTVTIASVLYAAVTPITHVAKRLPAAPVGWLHPSSILA